jgi:hypothetical protein
METRVLNDLDEKLHNMGSMFFESPKLIKTIYDIPGEITSDVPIAFYILLMCSQAYHMRQRKIPSDNEWAGWLQWIKNAFRYGTIGKYWKQYEMETWFDPLSRISSTPKYWFHSLIPTRSEIKLRVSALFVSRVDIHVS